MNERHSPTGLPSTAVISVDAEGLVHEIDGRLGSLEQGDRSGLAVGEVFADQPDLVADLDRARNGTTTIEFRIVDGVRYKLCCVPLPGSSPPHPVVCVARPIDSTRTLLRRPALVKAILDSTLQCIITIDDRGRVIEFNPEAERVFGYVRSDLLGRPIAETLIPERLREAHKAGLEHYRTTGEGPVLGQRIEVTAVRADGVEIPVELAITPTPTADQMFFTACLRDLSQQKATERAIRLARFTLDQVGEAILWIDASGQIVDANQAAVEQSGQTRANLLRRQVFDFDQSVSKTTWADHWLSLKENTQITYESRYRRSDGSEFYIEVSSHFIIDEGRELNCTIIRDITERRRMLLQLERALDDAVVASKAKDTFFACMSHELRTPLTAVLGFSEMLTRPMDPAAQHRLIDRIQTTGRELLSVINDILDLARLEAEKTVLDLESISLLAMIDRAVRLVEPSLLLKHLDLSVTLTNAIPRAVVIDGFRAARVLTNLLTNAVKYTEKGSIRISVQFDLNGPNEAALLIRVDDTGIGIPPESLKDIFEPFERAASESITGTGLGLAICYRMMQLLGGEIRASSEVDVGSSFQLLFPVTEWSADRHQPGPVELVKQSSDVEVPGPQRALQGTRILLAEDTEENREVILFFLREEGASVECCKNGAEALSELGEPPSDFDLVLMDMNMPVLDGYAATRRARERGHVLPIVALTAHSMASDRQLCISAGCTDYLSKPVDVRRLIELCRRFGVRSPQAPSPLADHPAFRKLVHRFNANLVARRAEILRMLMDEDLEGLQVEIHKLAGSAGNYGLPELSKVAQQCEETMRTGGGLEQIRRQVAGLAECMERITAQQ